MKFTSIVFALSVATLVFAAPPMKGCDEHPGKSVGHHDHDSLLKGGLEILGHHHTGSGCKHSSHDNEHGGVKHHDNGGKKHHDNGGKKHHDNDGDKKHHHTGPGCKHDSHKKHHDNGGVQASR